jgi:hypothetical protein
VSRSALPAPVFQHTVCFTNREAPNIHQERPSKP